MPTKKRKAVADADASLAAAVKSLRSSLVREVQLPVVCLGRQLSLEGWVAAEVEQAILNQSASQVACWNCCHTFKWAPCHIPLKHDPRFGGTAYTLYYSRGHFCTWQCAKSYHLRECKSASVIALVANRVRLLTSKENSGPETAVFLHALPRRESLLMFGGPLTIEKFRDGCMRVDGSFVGRERADSKSLVRRCEVPPAFIDEKIVGLVRCAPSGMRSSHVEAFVSSAPPHQSTRYPTSDLILRQKLLTAQKKKSHISLNKSMGITVRRT